MSDNGRAMSFLALLSILFLLPGLGIVELFDWDEINFAEISREMITTSQYLSPQINYEAFYEKPPLFFWFQALSMQVFGINEFAARLPNAICGILSLLILYRIGSKLFDSTFGLTWSICFFGSVLPFFYFKSGIIDPFFNLFIFLSICLYLFSEIQDVDTAREKPKKYNWSYLLLSGFALGLAILTKGPVAYLIVISTILIYAAIKKQINIGGLLILSFSALFLPALWLGAETMINGREFLNSFVNYHLDLLLTPVAGHKGFFGFHFIVLLVGCFPASVFCIRALFKSNLNVSDGQKAFILSMKILFWFVLILFTIVQSKIIHYSSLCYFPLTFLAAFYIREFFQTPVRLHRFVRAGIYLTGGFFILLCIGLVYLGRNPELLAQFSQDLFFNENLKADVSWTYLDASPAIILLISLILFNWKERKDHKLLAICTLFVGTALFSFFMMWNFIPKVEQYTQHAAIEFYKDKADQDCYIETWGYKSYAHLFYSQKLPQHNVNHSDKNWLLKGEVDKDVFMVVRVSKENKFKTSFPAFEEVSRKDGYVFFKRTAVKNE